MTHEQEIRNALVDSIDTMRLAEHMLRLCDSPNVAELLRERADKSVNLLLPWAPR